MLNEKTRKNLEKALDLGNTSNAAIEIYRIFGQDGHKQRMAFSESNVYNWSDRSNTRIVGVFNSDFSDSFECSILLVIRNTHDECRDELQGQIYDGIFESCKTGKVELIWKN